MKESRTKQTVTDCSEENRILLRSGLWTTAICLRFDILKIFHFHHSFSSRLLTSSLTTTPATLASFLSLHPFPCLSTVVVDRQSCFVPPRGLQASVTLSYTAHVKTTHPASRNRSVQNQVKCPHLPSQPSGDWNIPGVGTGELKGRKAGIISEITSTSQRLCLWALRTNATRGKRRQPPTGMS